jgi:hypothetical protein
VTDQTLYIVMAVFALILLLNFKTVIRYVWALIGALVLLALVIGIQLYIQPHFPNHRIEAGIVGFIAAGVIWKIISPIFTIDDIVPSLPGDPKGSKRRRIRCTRCIQGMEACTGCGGEGSLMTGVTTYKTRCIKCGGTGKSYIRCGAPGCQNGFITELIKK